MLVFDRLEVVRGPQTRIHADLRLDAGESLGIIGPSGVGKSTLMEALAGLIAPVSGQLLWQDAAFTDTAPHARPVAMMSQSGNLFSHLPVRRSLELTLAPDRRRTSADRDKAETALAGMGLQGKGDRLPGELSGGERVRAGLARVLLADKPILILDEPFGALGPALKAEMRQRVAEAVRVRKLTLLLVSHEMDDIEALCPAVAVLADGRLHAPAPTAEILSNPPQYLARYLNGGGDTVTAGRTANPTAGNSDGQ